MALVGTERLAPGRSDYHAKRVLAAFDRNGDGVISKDELPVGVRELVVGTDREELHRMSRPDLLARVVHARRARERVAHHATEMTS